MNVKGHEQADEPRKKCFTTITFNNSHQGWFHDWLQYKPSDDSLEPWGCEYSSPQCPRLPVKHKDLSCDYTSWPTVIDTINWKWFKRLWWSQFTCSICASQKNKGQDVGQAESHAWQQCTAWTQWLKTLGCEPPTAHSPIEVFG